MNQIKRKSISNLIAFFLIFFIADSVEAAVKVVPSSRVLSQGLQFKIEIILEDITPAQAELYYRVQGSRLYQQIPLKELSKGSNEVEIPGSVVMAPAIEYYIKIVDISGKVFTSPSNFPEYSPYVVSVIYAPKLPEIKLISPSSASVPISDLSQKIVFEATGQIKKNILLVKIDNTDVTSAIQIKDRKIIIPANLMKQKGKHTIVIGLNQNGQTKEQSWQFEVAEKEKYKTLTVHGSGGLSINYGHQIKSPDSKKDTLSANLNLSMDFKGKNWQMQWSGINVQYVKDSPSKEFTISSGFYFVYEKNEQLLEYGDISIKETALTAPSFARRGLQAKLKGYATELHLFNVSADTVSGWSAGIGGTSRQVYGASIKRPILSEGRMPVTVVFITGKNSAANGFNAAGTQASSEGQIAALAVEHKMGSVSFSTEIAMSEFDPDTTDGVDKKQDGAGTLNLTSAVSGYTLSAAYFYYGPDFASIANPNFTSDREGISGSISRSFGPLSSSVTVSQTRDNVEGDRNRPVVYSTSASVTVGFSQSPWPAVSLSYTRSMQNSKKEPPGTQEVENTNDTVSLGISMAGQGWSTTLSGNYGKLTDEAGGLGSESKAVGLSGSFTPVEGLNLSPTASYTESSSAGVTKRTKLLSLTASVPLFSSYTNTSFQISYTINDSSDGSQHTRVLNGSWRLAVNIDRLLKKWIDYGTEMLALTANYNKVEDKVNPANSKEDLSVFLSINAYAPFDFSFGF